MKTLKSCLLIFLVFCLLIFGGIFFYFQKLNSNCIQDNKKVEESFGKLKDKLEERNLFFEKINISDSTKILAIQSDSILKTTNNADELIWTEFKLNEKTYKNDSLKSINDELNLLKDKYNTELKEFNSNWAIFPYNLIKIRQNFSKYTFLNIDYGKTNQENMKKKKEVENWIETGKWK